MSWRYRPSRAVAMLEWTRDCQPCSRAWLKRIPFGACVVPEDSTMRQPAASPAAPALRPGGVRPAASQPGSAVSTGALGCRGRSSVPTTADTPKNSIIDWRSAAAWSGASEICTAPSRARA